MYRSGNDSPLHLSTKIRNYLKYKAWAEGILVLELRADGIEKYCSICGSPGKNRANCSSARTATRSTTFWTAPETWPANASKAFRKDLDQKVNKRQKCLLYRCWEIGKRGSASDAPSSGWIPPGGPRRRRQRTMWPPFVGGWGVFEVIEMKFDIPNVDCNFIVITVP